MHHRITQVADLEDAVALRNEAVAAASSSAAPPLPTASSVAPPLDLEADTDGPDPALWTLGKRHETPGLLDRVDPSSPLPLTTGSARGGSGGGVSSRGSGSAGTKGGGRGRAACCSPPRVRLRTRIGKRCRKDLAAGRTGILIKATFNPLEGDSSTANVRNRHVHMWLLRRFCDNLLVPHVSAWTKLRLNAHRGHGGGYRLVSRARDRNVCPFTWITQQMERQYLLCFAPATLFSLLADSV